MNVDKKTGLVTSVEIRQSTGHKMLDQCVVDALQQWRFKPGTVSKVKTPITFSMAAQKSTN
jgi:TonB family protein